MTTLTIEQDTFKPFFQLSKEAIKLLWGAKLSGNDWKVYSFLSLIDPFGDRWCELPSIKDICTLLEMSKTSFYRAIAKLKNEGIIKAEIKGFMFQNILGFAKMRSSEQNCDDSRKNEKTVAKMQGDSQNCENREHKDREDKGSSVSQTVQTSQTFSYSPDCGEEKEKKDKQETGQEDYGQEGNVSTNGQIVENISSSSQNQENNCSISTNNLNQEGNFRSGSISEASSKGMVQGSSTKVETNNEGNGGAIGEAATPVIAPVEKPQLRRGLTVLNPYYQNPVQQINWQWLPNGAWKTPEGKLDPHFQEWFAKIFFVEQFGHEFNLAVANVESYFRNDLRRLPSRWKQYHKEYLAKLKNTAMLLDHDVKIPEERRKNTINRVRAIQPVASEQSVSTNPTPVDSNLQSLESIVNSVTAPQVNPQNILNPAVNSEVNSGVEELEAEVIEAETIADPWAESEETESIPLGGLQGSALTQIEVKDTEIEVTNTQIEVKDTQPKYVYIDNSDCPDPEVISVVYRDFTGIAEQMEKERREAPPINPLFKAMTEDFITMMSGKPITRPLPERIDVINYALSNGGRNKYFFAQAQQFINQGWKVDFNDEGEPIYIHPDSAPTTPNSNLEVNDLGKNPIDSFRLMEKAKELNEALKDKILRSSSFYINQVKQFLSLDWLADYDSEGFPTEVYQF